jgi:chromosome segregation ATPase
MEEQYQKLQEYNNELLLKQSLLKEELAQNRTRLEEITQERVNFIAVISRLEDKKKVLDEEIGNIDKQHNELLSGCGEIRAEIEGLVSTANDMQQQYNDLCLAGERIRSEISQLEVSRNNAQQQYEAMIAVDTQVKMEIASRDNAHSAYSTMINHNGSTNSQIYSLNHERDNIQNQQINPYMNALQEARNAAGTIKADNYYYNVTIEKKHTVRGLFGIKLDPKYTYHTERRFNQDGYNNAVGAANTRISNAENQLNIQKANYLGYIDNLNVQISTKQSSLYSAVAIQQALQTLNTAQHAVAARGITLETSEQQVTSALQKLNNASSVLNSRQEDLNHNEQKKGQVAESVTMTSNMINARESDLRSQEQKEHEIDSILKEKQAMFAALDQEIGDHRLVVKNLDSALSNIKEELITLEEACRAGELEITVTAEKVEAVRLELERLEVERVKAEQLEVQRLEAQKLANTEKVEIVDDIFGIDENQILGLGQGVVNIDLSGEIV